MNTESTKVVEKKDDIVNVDNNVEKQKKEKMQINKNDSISKIGKLFTGNRRECRRKAKLIKKRRNNDHS